MFLKKKNLVKKMFFRGFNCWNVTTIKNKKAEGAQNLNKKQTVRKNVNKKEGNRS